MCLLLQEAQNTPVMLHRRRGRRRTMPLESREKESMGGEDNGLTLQGLAHRLEAVERENERMRSENDALRSKVATLEGSGTRRDAEAASEFEGQVSRRSLLSKAGAAAVAAVAAGTLLSPRQARAHAIVNRDNIEVGNVDAHYVFAHYVQGDTEGVAGGHGVLGLAADDALSAVHGRNSGSAPGVEGISNGSNGTGVKGTGRYGVWGESNQAGFYGVTGRNINTDGTGVRGVANNDNGGAGVRGEGSTGVWGSSSRTGYSGVYGQHTGTSGYGVVGDGKGGSAGVLGRNSGGEGVRGEGSTQAEVAGVRGIGKTGMWGSSAATGYSGVYGQHTGSAGFGLVGD